MIRESEYNAEVIGTKFNKPLAKAKKDHEVFKSSTKCWICKRTCKEGEVKVKDSDHITGKYFGFAHQECNLNLSLNKKFLLCFIICKTMIHILSFNKLEKIITK